jgi:PAS domain-containing protein
MDDAIGALMSQAAGKLRWCLLDVDPRSGPHRLAGPSGCDRLARMEFAMERRLNFAERDWALRLDAGAAQLDESEHANAWLFSVLGMAAASLLGALLLVVTGRSRRIELAVDERTTALRHEVSERQRTEEALRGSEQQLRAILDTARVGIVMTDRWGRILKLNPAYCRLLGYTVYELLKRQVGS